MFRRSPAGTISLEGIVRLRYRIGSEVRELALLALHAAACSFMYALTCSLVKFSFVSLCVVLYVCTRSLREPSARFAQNRSEVSELDLFALHARDCEPRIIAISELVMARSFSLALVLYWEIVFDSVAWLGPRLPALLLRGGAGGIAKRDSRL